MNSHELGDYYESLSQEDLLKQYATQKPRIIDTKKDEIHGLDYAMAFEDNSFVMIVENKSPFGSIQGEQKEKSWLNKQLQDLHSKQPNHELFKVIQQCLQKGGKVVFQGIQTNENSDLVSKRISPQHFIEMADLPYLYTTNHESVINQFNHPKTNKTMMTLGDRRIQFFLDDIQTLADFQKRLVLFKDNLNKELNDLKVYYSQLAEENRWNDAKHAEYAENYISVIEQNIASISNLLETESIAFLQRYEATARELLGVR
jgi:hypothetical protein